MYNLIFNDLPRRMSEQNIYLTICATVICYKVGHSERLQSYNGHFDFPDILKYCTVVLGTYKTEIEWRRKREEKKEKNKREKNKKIK